MLGLYCEVDTASDLRPWLKNDDELNTRVRSFLQEKFWPVIDEERARFARALADAKIVNYRAHHYQFIPMLDDTECRMREFLASLRNM